MTKLWLYMTSLLKYFIVILIVNGIMLYFFLNIVTLIIAGLLFLGMFGAAWTDMKERYDKKQKKKELRFAQRETANFAAAARHELEGFEQALSLTMREMRAHSIL
ncbi:hypothetical protein [Cohnella sp.]|uniref:hypothetical protein n=1 Tax=Cohnella sp. TaxID=1883426 RepID=UPI003703AAB9